MSGIEANINDLRSRVPANVKIIAVSKTKPVEDILRAYNAGQRIFGENRVQEIVRKRELLPSDIEWHMIGHLQTNKVKLIAPFISMIQSVDTMKLLMVIDSESGKHKRTTDCLLQLHIAKEETKSGFSMEELLAAIGSPEFPALKNVRICGLMGMATFTEDKETVRGEFRYLAGTFRHLKDKYFREKDYFREISMGMSGDFTIAVEEGSTMVRVGSLIFGERNKHLKDNG